MRKTQLKKGGAGNFKLGHSDTVSKASIHVNRKKKERSTLRVLVNSAQLMFPDLMCQGGKLSKEDNSVHVNENTHHMSVTNNAEAAKSSGCTVTTAITVTGPGTAPSGGKAPHFTRACARRASEADNPDKPGAGSNNKSQTTTVSATAKPHPVLVATRSSGRVIKRPRRDGSPPPSPPKKQDCKQDGHTPDRKSADRKADRKQRGRRQWELWSVEDKQIFFGGLYEFGKDFDAIQNLFAQKHKRKGDPETLNKTKDQIRHFYYRTWHKIAKYIETNNDTAISKQAMELYGLINYGELRKKIGSKLDDKNGQKLNELIQRGTTVIKVKGRTHRVKTPGCRALKKMNNVEESTKEDDNNRVKIPDYVTIELAPYTNAAWAQVQEMAQNPRMRIKLKPDRKLSNVIEFLNKKWKPNRVRMKESLEEKEQPQQEIKLHLAEKVKVFPVDLEIAPPQPRLDLGFIHYKEYIRTHPVLENSPSSRKGRGGSKSGGHPNKSSKQSKDTTNKSPSNQPNEVLVKEEPDAADIFACLQAHHSNSNHSENNDPVPMETDSEALPTEVKHSAAFESCREESSLSNDACTRASLGSCDTKNETGNSVDVPVVSEAVSRTPAGAASVSGIVPKTSPTAALDVPSVSGIALETKSALEPVPETPSVSGPSESNQSSDINEKVQLLHKGLTRKEAGQFSIAELCLMTGSPGKIQLYYEWVDIVVVPDILQLNTLLTNKLRRLIHLASTEFTDFRKMKPPELVGPESPHRCTCGRAQFQATTPTVKGAVNKKVGRSPATPKGLQAACSVMLEEGMSQPGTPKSTQTVAAFPSPPNATTIITGPTTTKGPASDDGVFPLPVGIPLRPRSITDKTDPLSAINRPDMFIPRRRRLQRNVRRPMLPVQRTLLPKTMASLTLLSSGSQMGTPGSFLTALPNQIPSPAVVSTSPTGGTRGLPGRHAKPEQMRPVIRRIVPNPMGLTAANALTMSPADIMKRAVIKADLQSVIAKNLLQNVASSSSSTATPSSVLTSVGTAVTSNTSAINVNGSLSSVDREVNGNSASSATAMSQSLVKSAIVGEDSFLGVSPQMPTVVPSSQAAGAATNGMGDLSLQGGESLSGLSCLLDISLPVPADGDTTDKFLDMSMGENTRTTFFGILDERSNGGTTKEEGGGTSELQPVTPALSPTKSFRLPGEFQWPGGESGDYLSQLLESPAKKPVSASQPHTTAVAAAAAISGLTQSQVSLLSESSRDSIILGKLDVDSTLQCMLNENSMDYVAKFADLAAQIASTAGETGSSGNSRRTDP